jgi:hypothetical protein
MRLQAADGVTTALELEGGALSLEGAYREAASYGRPINHGFSASWAAARMAVLDGLEPPAFRNGITAHMSGAKWATPGSADDMRRVLDILERDLELGALGIGVLVGYAPQTTRREYLEVARLAARFGVPTYTHARSRTTPSRAPPCRAFRRSSPPGSTAARTCTCAMSTAPRSANRPGHKSHRQGQSARPMSTGCG